MARWGNCDFEQLKNLEKKLQQFQKTDLDLFCRECAKELAARLLRMVIKRTPVGEYPAGSGKVGGTLRRGWTGGVNSNPTSYARSLPISKQGNDYVIEIKNPVDYSSHVEFGHRTPTHNGWVPGKFMLTISEQELQGQANKIIEKKLIKILGEMLDA